MTPPPPPSPRLARTPRGRDGSPLRVPTDHARAAAALLSGEATPLLGARRRVEGVDMVDACFITRRPGARRVLVHLSNLTDRHRTDLRPSLLEPGDAPGVFAATFLLPADGIISYRLADVSDLADDIGTTRAGWRTVHERGLPDAANPAIMPTPLGGDASVYYGPDAPWSGWTGSDDGFEDVEVRGTTASVLAGDDRVVVLFDRSFWLGLGLGGALRAAGLDHTLVLVDHGGDGDRVAALTDPDRAAALVRAGLAAAERVHDRPVVRAEAIAGQSLGGLATAAVLARHPGLARAGIVQSGSFWWRADGQDGGATGDLVTALRSGEGDVSTPVVIQVGSEEDQLLEDNRVYRDALLARGALAVGYREVRGGHDYAWWRHGVVDALARLDGPATRPRA